jgi:hypothetical protein
MVKHRLDKVLITLEVGNTTALFILLDKYGNIHRKGNGNAAETSLELAQGVSNQKHFDALLMTVPDSIFDFTGVVKQTPIQGKECSLSIIFNGPDDVDYSFRSIYGDESQGPAAELVQILINAVKITDPWYAEQLTPQQPLNTEAKKWWEFWK